MRRLWIGVATVMLTAACAHTPASTPAPVESATVDRVNPSNIKRMSRDMPPGYEVTPVSGTAAPPAIWGLGSDWTADPSHCAALADPAAGRGQSPQGVSGSGDGGIVYTVIAAAPVRLDPALVVDCPHWTMTNGAATTRVHLIAPPQVDGVETLGMASETIMPVEGGGEIVSQATTFTAYLGGYYAFTALITDPGSPQPPLPAQFAADLLVNTVAELRR
ncbi:DUF5642 family protein [Mycobacterium kyorinense]|uniref:DUF5642 domain-containing protein n=1 Tax=Mycobacterium kyorinense TaxID=487514 RepID=A0A1X1XVP8_9MYCO|nr:DUF5642 family protein [Mycobacterium kyorinense]ORW02942.1 hypothetical protein AWC14_05825 [Mycobacterium kyorinense]